MGIVTRRTLAEVKEALAEQVRYTGVCADSAKRVTDRTAYLARQQAYRNSLALVESIEEGA